MQCPKCHNEIDEIYRIEGCKGRYAYFLNLDGTPNENNGDMYQHLTTTFLGKTAYCPLCGERVGSVNDIAMKFGGDSDG